MDWSSVNFTVFGWLPNPAKSSILMILKFNFCVANIKKKRVRFNLHQSGIETCRRFLWSSTNETGEWLIFFREFWGNVIRETRLNKLSGNAHNILQGKGLWPLAQRSTIGYFCFSRKKIYWNRLDLWFFCKCLLLSHHSKEETLLHYHVYNL